MRALPRMPASRLLKSWAMPPASTPRLSSFWRSASCAASLLCSVRSVRSAACPTTEPCRRSTTCSVVITRPAMERASRSTASRGRCTCGPPNMADGGGVGVGNVALEVRDHHAGRELLDHALLADRQRAGVARLEQGEAERRGGQADQHRRQVDRDRVEEEIGARPSTRDQHGRDHGRGAQVEASGNAQRGAQAVVAARRVGAEGEQGGGQEERPVRGVHGMGVGEPHGAVAPQRRVDEELRQRGGGDPAGVAHEPARARHGGRGPEPADRQQQRAEEEGAPSDRAGGGVGRVDDDELA